VKRACLFAVALTCACAPSVVGRMRRQANALRPQVAPGWVARFLEAAATLQDVAPRTLFHDVATDRWENELERAGAPDAGWTASTVDAEFYYEARWGSPLAYARALEVAEPASFEPRGKRIFDFGYGSIGHLKMLAALGADVHAVDVDARSRALYAYPGDQGPVPGGGRVSLLHGFFPSDAALVQAAGQHYALVLSKNVLKRGYIHPERPADPKHLVHLGVSDEAFLATVHAMLDPGGRFLIYNICPGPNSPDKPYVPWADGRSPFAQEAFERNGFRVLAFDRDDLPAVQAMARALNWDSDTDLQHDLQATYTLVERL